MENNHYKEAVKIDKRKLIILLKSCAVGLLAGLVVSFYRYILTKAEYFSMSIYSFLKSNHGYIILWLLILVGLSLFVRFLLKKHDMISSGGIAQVKGIIYGYLQDNWLKTLVFKIIGGFISIFAGLSLGMEGPSVQIGAAVGDGLNKKSKCSNFEKKILIASGAGAGLSAAFGAPLSGAVFALEEIFKYFSPVILFSTMISAVCAEFVSGLFFPDPVFNFRIISKMPFDKYWILIILAVLLGLAGAFYNFVIVGFQNIYKKIKISDKLKIIIPFLIAAIVGLTFPSAICGGHFMIDNLGLSYTAKFLLIFLTVKFLFSMISFASKAPGGIFFPQLVMGATIGAIFAKFSISFFGISPSLFYNFVILAMSGFFSAIVRAPITGIVLLVEMTGSINELMPITLVCVLSYFIADFIKSRPIYDSLLYTLLLSKRIKMIGDENGKTTIETMVSHNCKAEGKCIKYLKFPKNSLLISVKRNGRDFIPNGNTILLANDYLVFITNIKSETRVKRRLKHLMDL